MSLYLDWPDDMGADHTTPGEIPLAPEPAATAYDARMAEEIRPRAAWDEYFMSIAQVVATRSTCPRKYVGSVIVRNRTILSTGYNGSIRGMPHCSDVGHMMEDNHCVATIHAEANAIIQAAKNGVLIDGGSCYVTASPCWNCFKQLANAGITRICFGEFYRDNRIFEIAGKIGIELVHTGLPGVNLPALPPVPPPE